MSEPTPLECVHGFTLPPGPDYASQCAACCWQIVLALRTELAALRLELAGRPQTVEAGEGMALLRRLGQLPLNPPVREGRHACKVCGNAPDEDGMLEHGRGCYTRDADGGGSEYIEKADVNKETP